MSASEQDRLEINWFNSAGAALGAVSAAVVLSSLGAAGTLVGAALGSLCITIGGAVYAHSMRVAKDRVAAAKELALRRRTRAEDGLLVGAANGQPSAGPDPVDADPAAAPPARESWMQVSRGLPWKRIGAASAALFAVAMGIILAFELTTGRAVSTYTGGTSDTEVGTTFSGFSARDSGSETGGDDGQPGQSEEPEESEQSEQDQPQQQDSGELPAQESPDGTQEEEQAPDQEEPAPAETEVEEAPAPAEEPEPAPQPEPEPATPESVPGE